MQKSMCTENVFDNPRALNVVAYPKMCFEGFPFLIKKAEL
jgi:hypothetical protein